jgi:hypothetical protein
MRVLSKATAALLVASTLLLPTSAQATTEDCSTAFSSAQVLANNGPSNLNPIPGTRIANEGIWQPTKIKVAGQVAIKTARVRFDNVHGKNYATVIWLNPSLLAFKQIPGKTIPQKGLGPGKVPAALKPCYVAAFTGGYLMKDSEGGAQYDGKTVKNLINGIGTLITYTDGTIDVVKWPDSDRNKVIAQARQNLKLIVEDGVSKVPHSEPHNSWGWVWNGTGINKNDVQRTGVGIKADGTVVWVMGANLNATNLANLLIRAGAVRALALDMNKGFANGYLYGPYHTKTNTGGIIDPNITQWPSRFWNATQRDFVAVFARP